MNFDDIKIYLPKFLSSKSEKELFENLQNFPANVDERIYTSALKDSNIIFQGDGISDMLVVNLPDTTVKNVNSLIFSNTCDIDPSNKRLFNSQVVYSPIFSLEKYEKLITTESSKSPKQIKAHIKSIKEQKITQIFYLPKINNVIEDSIIFLDRVNNCPVDYIKSGGTLNKERLFTLSDYGAYIFVLKLSIHFTRIKDKVDRLEGTLR